VFFLQKSSRTIKFEMAFNEEETSSTLQLLVEWSLFKMSAWNKETSVEVKVRSTKMLQPHCRGLLCGALAAWTGPGLAWADRS